jgi:hypothetical protein
MSYDHESTSWIIAEPAPILTAWNSVEVAGHVSQLLDIRDWERLSIQGQEWFARNHSSTRIANDHLNVYRRILRDSSGIAGTVPATPEPMAKSA